MLEREAAPLRKQLVARLRNDLLSDRYQAGDRLIEKTLEAEYGVSRTVVREALRQLESEQLVEMVPNVGPRVRGLTYDDAIHLYQVRAALESAAARFAAQRADKGDLHRLDDALDHLVRRADSVSPTDLLTDKEAFYDALIAASGNPIIGELLSNVRARIARLRAITLSTPDRIPRMLSELRSIVRAVKAGDPVRAGAAAQLHVESAAAIALKHLADEAAEDGGAA